MKCDMHDFWEAVYSWSDHAHRDPVANVVIYSSICLFTSTVAWVLTIPAYLELIDLGNDFMCGTHPGTCHFLISIGFAVITTGICVMGILAGELHRPWLYSLFNGMGIISIFGELYCLVSVSQTTVSLNKGVSTPNIINADSREIINGLMYTVVGCHAVSVFCILTALRYSFRVNFHFTRQEKLVFADMVRKRITKIENKGGIDLGVAEIEDHDFKPSGLTKGKFLASRVSAAGPPAM